MFNNANVLFKTRFVDGVSQVSRQQQKLIPDRHSGDGRRSGSNANVQKRKKRVHNDENDED